MGEGVQVTYYKTTCQVECVVTGGQPGPEYIGSALIEPAEDGRTFEVAKDGLVRHLRRNLGWLEVESPGAEAEIRSARRLLEAVEGFTEAGMGTNGTALP